MDDEPETAVWTHIRSGVDPDGDALSDAAELTDRVAFDSGDRRVGGAQDEDTPQADTLELCPKNARLKRSEIRGDVGEFRH